MRRAVRFALLSLSFLAAAGAAFAGDVVLKDGTVLNTSKPYTV